MKNNIKYSIFLVFLFVICCLTNSCMCDCHCKNDLGCKILNVKLISNDSLIKRQIFCSKTNYYTDETLLDSVNAFYLKYKSDTTTIIAKDSIYQNNTLPNVDCDKRSHYEKLGYNCECFK